MRSAKDILKDLGFNANAPQSTKDAFLKNLAEAAKELDQGRIIAGGFGIQENENSEKETGKQLSFDSELLGVKVTARLKTGA